MLTSMITVLNEQLSDSNRVGKFSFNSSCVRGVVASGEAFVWARYIDTLLHSSIIQTQYAVVPLLVIMPWYMI